MSSDWLTYVELADKFGSTPEAMRQRTLRSQWRRQTNNEGKTIVLLPSDISIRTRKRKVQANSHTDQTVKQSSSGKDLERIILSLESHVLTLQRELSLAHEQIADERKIALESLTVVKNLTAELASLRSTAPVVQTRQTETMDQIIMRMKMKAAAKIVAA